MESLRTPIKNLGFVMLSDDAPKQGSVRLIPTRAGRRIIAVAQQSQGKKKPIELKRPKIPKGSHLASGSALRGQGKGRDAAGQRTHKGKNELFLVSKYVLFSEYL